MSGYREDFSKSNNAHDAELEGKFPASVLAARIGVKAGAVRALLSPCEWHHSSKFYNPVEYFDEESAIEIIDELRNWVEPVKSQMIHEGCSGVYLEWSGTGNHPHAKEIEFSGITVLQKGMWFTLELPEGPIRKKKDTRGFVLYDSTGKRLNW